MRELSKQLYLTRREFVKGLVTVGVGAVAGTAGLSGCLEYIKPKTPEPAVKKRFTPDLRIEGDEEFKRNVENMLRVLKEYSPEWYEKTMYAGEVIEVSDVVAASKDGTILLDRTTSRFGGSKNVTDVLIANDSFAHEIQHIIDDNVYRERRDMTDKLEDELRAGIAISDYRISTNRRNMEEEYNHMLWYFNEAGIYDLKIDKVKYKDRLEEIERMYFDHENKRLKTNFLNESWQKFKSL